MTVWQCELRDLDSALNRIVLFLGPPGLKHQRGREHHGTALT